MRKFQMASKNYRIHIRIIHWPEGSRTAVFVKEHNCKEWSKEASRSGACNSYCDICFAKFISIKEHMYCYRGQLIKDIVWASLSTKLARQIQGESEGIQMILGGPGILLYMFC